jgi:hypothetical protein
MKTDAKIFDSASGNVRGSITATADIRGGITIGNAILFTDRIPQIEIRRIPSKLSVSELRELACAFEGFADAVSENS